MLKDRRVCVPMHVKQLLCCFKWLLLALSASGCMQCFVFDNHNNKRVCTLDTNIAFMV